MKKVIFPGWDLYFEFFDKCSAVAEMGDHLPTIDIGGKVGSLLYPFPWGRWVPI